MDQGKSSKDGLYLIPGHPLQNLARENRAVEAFLAETLKPHLEALEGENSPEIRGILRDDVIHLAQIERHYNKINKLIMPHIVAYAGVAPQRVMMGIQEDVLRMIRDLQDDLETADPEPNGLRAFAAFLIRDIEIIIRQEREAYAQEASRLISDVQWREIAKGENAFGYCMIEPLNVWPPEEEDKIHIPG